MALTSRNAMRIGLWLSCLVATATAQSAATDAPANFQGFYLHPVGTTERVECGTSSVFALSHTFAGCCSIGGNCNFPTACAAGRPTNRFGRDWTCGPDRDCYTMTVYGDYASPTESWIVYNCAKTWSATTIYRTMAQGATKSATTVPPTATAGSGAGVTTPAPTVDQADEDGDGDGAAVDSGGSSSMAWVAGVVVGGIGLLAALGVVLFWMLRRRARKADGGGGDGHGPEEAPPGFVVHSAAMRRSGGQPYQHFGGAVTVADGVEMEGSRREKWLVPPNLDATQEAASSPMSAELDGRVLASPQYT